MTICMGYWPGVRSRWLDIGQVLFLRVYGPRRSRGPYTRKKRTRPISSHLDRTNLVNKEFIIWLLVKFCLRDTAGSPERARWLHLARSGSQSQLTIWFILPARGASHIIMTFYFLASFASGQDEPNGAMWLATRAGKMEPSCLLGTTRCIPQDKFPWKPYNKYFIDQVCSVKMAGYWPRSFFAKKRAWPISKPSWPHTWSITHIYSLNS